MNHCMASFFSCFPTRGDSETGRIPQVFCKEKSGSATHVDHFLGVSRFLDQHFQFFSPWHFTGDLMAVIYTTYTSLSMLLMEEILTKNC